MGQDTQRVAATPANAAVFARTALALALRTSQPGDAEHSAAHRDKGCFVCLGVFEV